MGAGSSPWIFRGVALAVVAAIVGAAMFFISSYESEETKVKNHATAFLARVGEGDATGTYSEMTPGYQGVTSPAEWSRFIANFSGGLKIESWGKVDILTVKDGDKMAILQTGLHLNRGLYRLEVRFMKVDGKWLLHGFIVDGLAGG